MSGGSAAGAADCDFCRILAGELPGTFVHHDDRCAAFMDIRPENPGHLLVVPLQHAAYLADIDAPTAGHLMEVAHRLAAGLRASELRCEGVNLFLADGEAAMQEIVHLHLHVFPRYQQDGFGLRFGPFYDDRPPRAALEEAHENAAAYEIDVVCLEGEGYTSVDGEVAIFKSGQMVRWPALKQHRLWTRDSSMQTLMVEHPSQGPHPD